MPTSLTDAKRRVLQALKRVGSTTAPALAEQLGLTNAAIRQHLDALRSDGLVTARPESSDGARPKASGPGRPATVWHLTPDADRFFPDSHAELTVGLIEATRRAFGQEGLMRIVEVRARDQLNVYRSLMPPKSASLRTRVHALAEQRTSEGYMAQVVQEKPGVYLLIEHHCPICDAATSCQGLCTQELAVFQRTLGTGVRVERTEHLLSGDSRCAYRISKKP
jgi:predicted ArsR family transcriptional regulator